MRQISTATWSARLTDADTTIAMLRRVCAGSLEMSWYAMESGLQDDLTCSANIPEQKRSIFACNDIYCTPGSAGNASCAGQKCGYCSAVTSKCAEFPAPAINVSLPASPQLGQEVQEKRQSVSCNDIYCTPGEQGDKSCKDQNCDYCNWRTSKCAKFPSERRQSMACNNIYCTPGPEGDQSCQLQKCGSCNAEASKCM